MSHSVQSIFTSWCHRLLGVAVVIATLAGFALPAFAETAAAAAAPTIDSGNTAWMMISTALVLMMTLPGLALFYGGMVRKMNVLSTLMQSFAICAAVTLVWMIVGYSLTFTDGNPYIGDLSRFFLNGMGVASVPLDLQIATKDAPWFSAVIPESVFMMFQMTFAIITPALITGAFAERMKFSAMMVFMVLWSLLVYVPIAHWVWQPNGFLFTKGVLDFAGGTVVHINAGVAGLVASIMLGKRLSYNKEPLPPHNLVLTVIGGCLLWVGWFGFNAGSQIAADGRAGMAFAVTHIAAAAAAIAWMLTEWVLRGKPSVLGIVSGAVAGLIAITPAAGYVLPSGALAIGLIAGIACYWGATWLKNKLGYDDSLDAFGVHGIGGIVGAILTGVFAVSSVGGDAAKGLIDGNAGQVLTQLYGAGITIIWSVVVTALLLKIIDLVIGLRVSEEIERDGLDLNLHGEILH